MTPTMRRWHPTLLLAGLLVGACDLDITNPNSPGSLGANPTRGNVAAAANGLLIAFRQDWADFALDMGIIGREVLRFDGSDPRFTAELLRGPLDAGSDAFGGDHWFDQYTTIRGGNLLLAVLPTAQALTDQEKSAAAGYVQTIQALNYLMILNTHTQDSIPIVTDTAVTASPAPFVTNAAAFDYVVTLLEQAKADLQAGGGAFPFDLPGGFSGFDTPATFLQFNRAIRARVAVYRNDFTGALAALAESFIDPAQSLSRGVYMDYGTGQGDFANSLALDPFNSENFGHPSLATGAQLQADGVTPDQRFVDKLVARDATTVDNLTSSLGWVRYPTPVSPVPFIKNEELILLRAEANIGLTNLGPALTDINTVRVNAGRLQPLGGFADETVALDELLYNKLYSLMFEGGHRWIDARHYGRLNTLPIDRPTESPPDVVFATLPIPRDEVLARE